jgi:hypothetical protein
VRRSSCCQILSVLMFLAAAPASAVQVTLLGPATYTRANGAPTVYSAPFPGLPGPATLLIMNGDADGANRTSSATVQINGKVVAGPNAFNQNVGILTLTVDLQANNMLRVELKSAPASFLAVKMEQNVPAAGAGVIGPAGGVVAVSDPSEPLHGLTMSFPPGAVALPALIRIMNAPAPEFAFRTGLGRVHVTHSFAIEPSQSLLRPVTIRVPYEDSNADGLIDGTEIRAESIQVLWQSEADPTMFFRIPTAIDQVAHESVAQLRHFSQGVTGSTVWPITVTYNYAFGQLPTSLAYPDPAVFRREVTEAFCQWSRAVDGRVIFVNTAEADADFVVEAADICSFTSDRCEDTVGQVFHVLDNRFLPPRAVVFNTNNTPRAWDCRPRVWAYGPYTAFPAPTTPFLRAALHEFGHVMGLPDYPDTYPTNHDETGADPLTEIMRVDNVFHCVEGFPLTHLYTVDIQRVRSIHSLLADQVPDVTICSSGGGTANLVRNPSFELPIATDPVTFFVTIPEWTNTSSFFDAYEVWRCTEANPCAHSSTGSGGPGALGLAHDGTQYLELDTYTSSLNTTVYQDIPTIPGKTYTISFAMAHRRPDLSPRAPTAKFRVSFGNTAQEFETASVEWQVFSFTSTAPTNVTRLQFTDIGVPDTYDGFLDDVSVTQLP